MPLIDTDQLLAQLHAVAVTRRDYKAAQAAREHCMPGNLEVAIDRLDVTYLHYTDALLALGERVASLVDLEPPAPSLTIVATD